MTDFGLLFTAALGRLAEVVVSLRDHLIVPAGVDAAVTPRQQDSTGGHLNQRDVTAGIIDRHYASYRTGMKRAPLSAWVCQCGQVFTLRLEHAEHVADLISAPK